MWDINLESIGDSKKRLFLLQIKNLIEEDAQLKKSQYILDNQWQNDRHFEQMLVQVNQSINISINSSGKSETKINDGEPISFTLEQIKTKFIQENDNQYISHLSITRNWRICKESRYPISGFGCFYGVTGKIAEADISIDSQAIYSYGKLDSLFSLSDERPELRHILLNVLPLKNGIDYWLYLLSKIETTTTAIYIFTYGYHLLDNSLVNETPDSLHHVYFPLVCDEFLDVSFKNKHNLLPISDIVELLICLAKDCIDETFKGGSRVDKDCLDMSLIRFSLDQISYFAKTLLSGIADDETHRINSLPVWKFYLLFWLLEKCQDFGLLSESNMEADIQASISTTYINAFSSNIDNENYSFNANEIFDRLPWWRVNDKFLTEFLDIIQKPAKWGVKLDNTSSVGHHNKNLTRSYFQLMLCLYSKDRSDDANNKLIKKITGLLESCGFTVEADKHLGLFDYESNHDYSLWKKLTIQSDTINDESFERIIDVIKSDVPINRILEIYSQTNKEVRKTILLKQIRSISNSSFDELGIGNIEDSLNFACGAGQFDLAQTLLEKGLAIINDKESFLQQAQYSYHFSELKNKWDSYEFKVELLKIINDNSLTSSERIELLRKLENPFSSSNHDRFKYLFKSCNYFRRFMIAMAWYEENPETSYQYFDSLYKEDRNIQYSGNRLASKLAILDKNNSEINNYQHALSEWLDTVSDIDIQSIEAAFIQNWIDCLVKVSNHNGVEKLWSRLSIQQQNDIPTAIKYCQSLMRRGQNITAKLIFEDLNKYHDITNLGEDAETQIKELNELIVNEIEPVKVATLSTHIATKPKSNDELQRSYQEILAKRLPDMVNIIKGEEVTVEDFLYSQMFLIFGELQLRKCNLNNSIPSVIALSHRVMQEDYINDWVTSLFDHKHSEIGLSCRDQKRGGQSSSTKNPGEIDFFLCDKNNERIAIMEAFRLFSNDTTVINEHLNKIAGYDQQCLPLVFIIAYCDVTDFKGLCVNYKNDTLAREYNGFSRSSKQDELLTVIEDSDTIQTFKEVRYRGKKPITIYHFMANLRFST